MEQMRLLLAIVLSFLVFVVWQWLVVEPEVAKNAQDQQMVSESTVHQEDASAPSESSREESPQPTAEKAPAPATPSEPTRDDREARTIRVETPLYTVTLTERGASIDDLTLKNYRESAEEDSPQKEMIQAEARQIPLQTGWEGKQQQLAGWEDALYALDATRDVISVEDKEQSLEFHFTNTDGVTIKKQFVFYPDCYLIDMNVSFVNQSSGAIDGKPTIKIANVVGDPNSRISFEGPMALIDGKLEETKIKEIEKKPQMEGTFRWIGITDRYFMSVLIPEEPVTGSMKMEKAGEAMVIAELVLPEATIPQNTEKVYKYKVFIGPKDTELLAKVNYDLGKAVNFGMFDFLAKPFLWIMNQIYKVIPNYGIAIIILTLLTKIILWPLGNKSYKSMNDMKRMQPLMAEIREKYKDDKKKINEETMALYRTYKINPMGGCLPMIVQLPVFLALYRMLYQAIELRHAPFFSWINDLSAPDRLFHFGFSIPFMQPPYGIPVLTVVMGATMFLQQKMSPPPGDPTQAKMMMFMPLIFTVIFINFPAGLVLYWLTNNIFSIAQQYYIQKKFA
jgi:YidC/Oxa1 family membrane protein insertase